LIYSISGLKEMLLSVIFVPLLYATIRRGSANFGPLVAWGGVAIIAVSVVAEGMGSDLALSLFLARMIAIPGQLTAYYFDFFTSHDPYLLLHSVLHWFGSPPYDLEPPFLIGPRIPPCRRRCEREHLGRFHGQFRSARGDPCHDRPRDRAVDPRHQSRSTGISLLSVPFSALQDSSWQMARCSPRC
jgi:hypothetical protein